MRTTLHWERKHREKTLYRKVCEVLESPTDVVIMTINVIKILGSRSVEVPIPK